MIVSEDGTVTGSIDVSKLGEVEPKTDEAKAQIEQMRGAVEAGQKQAAEHAERLAEQERAQNPALRPRNDDSDSADRRSQAEQRQDAERQQAEADKNQPAQSDEVTQLQAQAEAAGVTVDKRWGADRLRQELASAQAASPRKQR